MNRFEDMREILGLSTGIIKAIEDAVEGTEKLSKQQEAWISEALDDLHDIMRDGVDMTFGISKQIGVRF